MRVVRLKLRALESLSSVRPNILVAYPAMSEATSQQQPGPQRCSAQVPAAAAELSLLLRPDVAALDVARELGAAVTLYTNLVSSTRRRWRL